MSRADGRVRWLVIGVVTLVAVLFAVSTAVDGRLRSPGWVGVALLIATTSAFALVRRRRRVPLPLAAATVAVGGLLPLLGSVGHVPGPAGYASGTWYVAGILALVLLLLWGERPLGAWGVVAALVGHTLLWGGVPALLSLAVLATVLLLAAVTAARMAILKAEGELERAAGGEREAIQWRALQDAYHEERQTRLGTTAAIATPMLQRLAAAEGGFDAADRAECRLLEQTIRDEIRGRRLLNDAVREQVMAHRRRGAVVQVHDDGGLDDEDPAAVDALLAEVAVALTGLGSDRIVLRTLAAGSPNAVSVVATTSDPIAAALGLDDGDDAVDLWLELPRPSRAARATA